MIFRLALACLTAHSVAGAVIGIAAGGAVLGIGLCLACFMVAAARRDKDEKKKKKDDARTPLTAATGPPGGAAYSRGAVPPQATKLSFSLNAAFEKC